MISLNRESPECNLFPQNLWKHGFFWVCIRKCDLHENNKFVSCFHKKSKNAISCESTYENELSFGSASANVICLKKQKMKMWFVLNLHLKMWIVWKQNWKCYLFGKKIWKCISFWICIWTNNLRTPVWILFTNRMVFFILNAIHMFLCHRMDSKKK